MIQKLKNKNLIFPIILGALALGCILAFALLVNMTSDTQTKNIRAKAVKLPGAVKVEIADETDSSVTLKWNDAGPAVTYRILKLNVASGEYEEIRSCGSNEESVEMARDAGTYEVQTVKTIHWKAITGQTSKEINVTSAVDDAKTYSSLTTIDTIGSDDVDLVTSITGNQSSKNPQSMCFTGDRYIVIFVNRSNTQGTFEVYSTDGKLIESKAVSGISHANGCTYNPGTGLIYVMKTYAGKKIHEIKTFDVNLNDKGSISTNSAPSGIAYDVSNNKYYMSAASRLYVTNGDMALEKTLHRKRTNHSQDMGAYNGVAMSCIWSSGNNSYIDMYRVSDGAYLGSYNVPLGELESVVVNDGHLVMLLNVVGSSRDVIYITKDRIDLP